MRLRVVFCVVCLLGCGADPAPKLTPVSGRLTCDGKPIPNIAVQLVPLKPKADVPPSFGITDGDGKFTLRDKTGSRGTPSGGYKVVLTMYNEFITKANSGAQITQEDRMRQYMELQKKYLEAPKKNGLSQETKLPFPKEFSRPETSPWDVEVLNRPITNLDKDFTSSSDEVKP